MSVDLTVFGGFYSLLVFVAGSWWQALPLAVPRGLSMAAIGFNIEHDGSHHSYSEHAWAVHQVETTVDFACRSKVVSWLLGGLFEHHPFLAYATSITLPSETWVEQTRRDFGMRYGEHASFRAGLLSPFRWLRRMGARTGAPQLVVPRNMDQQSDVRSVL